MVSGALIFNALAAGNADAVENEYVTLDECISHPTPTKEYHYHMWSPCTIKGNGWASTTTSPNMCINDEKCRDDPVQFAINAGWTDTQTYGKILGIAKDGHMIIGPYNQNGELWSCSEHDVCNGTFINGSYFYVSTTTFPYILGCFGPAFGEQSIAVTCSNASCPTGSDDDDPDDPSDDDDPDDDTGAIDAIANISVAAMVTISMLLSF